MNKPRVGYVPWPSLWLIAAGLAGCGGSSQAGPDGSLGIDSQISSQPLAGRVGGQAWSLATAQTNATLSEGERFWADIYAETYSPCSGGGLASTHHLILNIPKAVGDYPLSATLNQTFVIESERGTTVTDNFIATRGRLIVHETTATLIRGEARIEFNADNTVEGRFEVNSCP